MYGKNYDKGSGLWLLIRVNDTDRITEVWLSNADQQEQELDLKPLYKEYKSKGYLVAVYMSGKGDLLEYTKDLVCHNYVGRAQ